MARKSKLARNFTEYTSRSTIHGIGYIYDQKLGLFDRALWLVIVTSFMSTAMWMINSSYTTWQNNQVITTLKTTTKPVSELEFPAVTICADGQHMGLVEKVLYNNFIKWKEQNDNSNTLEDDLSTFMKEIYQITEEGTNILDILNTMISPEGLGTNAVMKNELACAAKKRRKRESVPIHSSVEATESKHFIFSRAATGQI